jgi:hypothetical protein
VLVRLIHCRKLAQESSDRERALHQTIRELRAQVSRQEDRYAWREEELRKEIQEMQLRCQAGEQRNEELASSVAEATKPLLRQIEILQQSHAAKLAVWESVENRYTFHALNLSVCLSVYLSVCRSVGRFVSDRDWFSIVTCYDNL